MQKWQKLPRSNRGETLIETLVATLIIALTSMLLLTMTITSARLNRVSDEAGKEFRADLATAEKGALAVGSSEEGKLIIQVDGGSRYEYEVLYSSPAGKMRSYDKKAEVAP